MDMAQEEIVLRRQIGHLENLILRDIDLDNGIRDRFVNGLVQLYEGVPQHDDNTSTDEPDTEPGVTSESGA